MLGQTHTFLWGELDTSKISEWERIGADDYEKDRRIPVGLTPIIIIYYYIKIVCRTTLL